MLNSSNITMPGLRQPEPHAAASDLVKRRGIEAANGRAPGTRTHSGDPKSQGPCQTQEIPVQAQGIVTDPAYLPNAAAGVISEPLHAAAGLLENVL